MSGFESKRYVPLQPHEIKYRRKPAATTAPPPLYAMQAEHEVAKLARVLVELMRFLRMLRDRKAHRALGYDTWPQLVEDKFEPLARQVFLLLTHARAIEAMRVDGEPLSEPVVTVLEEVARQTYGHEAALLEAVDFHLEQGGRVAQHIEAAVRDRQAKRRAERKRLRIAKLRGDFEKQLRLSMDRPQLVAFNAAKDAAMVMRPETGAYDEVLRTWSRRLNMAAPSGLRTFWRERRRP